MEVHAIHASHGGTEVLHGIDLSVGRGEVLAILGPSGSGKTTLLRCINALERPDSGTVRVDGVTLDYAGHVPGRSILALRRKTAMVFQSYNLFRNRTALRNVTEGLTVVRGVSRTQADRTARQALAAVRMETYADRYPSQLSGGQQQRVSIARALALKPDVILFDEPTSALDPERVGDVHDAIAAVADSGVTMVIVTHEVRFARSIATRVVFLDGGRILGQGTPEEIIDHPSSPRIAGFLRHVSPA
ncbi:amino acid ABC transporter ATP-binding protein [Bifidobacterium pullorum]|uniref:amino acid ABC transporter ATP-binding protein n=1 Tax=Bifidobacterium pullorum TaxID=78448 RepID=UPI002B275A95|nr:amino acid ABC transporter ATP-binding protein [Bifidobacterium pullorum]